MISKLHRFHGYGSLRFVYQNGKTVRGQLMSLKVSSNPKRDSYRLAIVVSKKVNKSAVARNRIRRRLYEAFRRQEGQMNGIHDIVCTVFSEQIVDLSPDELNKLVRSQLHQAGVISSKRSS